MDKLTVYFTRLDTGGESQLQGNDHQIVAAWRLLLDSRFCRTCVMPKNSPSVELFRLVAPGALLDRPDRAAVERSDAVAGPIDLVDVSCGDCGDSSEKLGDENDNMDLVDDDVLSLRERAAIRSSVARPALPRRPLLSPPRGLDAGRMAF